VPSCQSLDTIRETTSVREDTTHLVTADGKGNIGTVAGTLNSYLLDWMDASTQTSLFVLSLPPTTLLLKAHMTRLDSTPASALAGGGLLPTEAHY